MPRVLLAVLTLCAACVAAPVALASAPLQLVREGEPNAMIVLHGGRKWADASRTIMVEQHSAQCLQAHVLQMTGALLPIKSDLELQARVQEGRVVTAGRDAVDSTVYILLGDTPLTRELGVSVEDLTTSGIRVRSVGNALVLVGHPSISHPWADGGGLRAAVVWLLESWGCRYLWPGESGKVVPQRRSLVVPPIDHSFNPPIQQRELRWRLLTSRTEEGIAALGVDVNAFKQALAAAQQTAAAQLVPAARNTPSSDFAWPQWHGVGGDAGLHGGHAFGDAWQKWGAQHPEWFALQADGTRDQTLAGARSQFCVSNLELIQAIADEIIDQAGKDLTRLSFPVGFNDGGYVSFCTCANCEALDAPDAPLVDMLIFERVGSSNRKTIKHVSLSDRHVWFWNQIAQRVTAVHPNVLLTIDSYSIYATAPRREKLHPNLVLRYVPDTVDEWDTWQQAGAKRLYWRPNILLRGTKQGELAIYARSLAQTITRLSHDGMLAVDMDCITGSWATLGLNYYVAARVTWNPHLEYEQMLDDFCRSGFGSAAEAVRRYFAQAEQCYVAHGLYSAPLAELAAMRQTLSEAQRLAGADDVVQQRLDLLRIGLNYTELRQQIKQLVKAAEAKQPYDQARAGQLLDLHHLMLWDLALHQPLAVDAGLVTRYSANNRAWTVLGAPKRRPAASLLQRVTEAPRMTGRENSIEELLQAYGLSGAATSGQAVEPAASTPTVVEADETGKVIEIGKP